MRKAINLSTQQIWIRYADSIRPLPEMNPAEFAEKFRVLHSVYCSERPGPWDNSVFPYQPHIMNMGEEAIRSGKRGLVIMKSGQGGGTDLAINVMLWLKEYFPGPQLFMTATDKVAKEFGRERWEAIIQDCPPLKRRYLANKRGDILVKRFTDGKIAISGGQSVFNLQSTPYRVVGIDELDSLSENLGGDGDPIKLAEVRTDSFSGPSLMVAYAHPTTRDRGAAKIFYETSDQRRGFVKHKCGGEFWFQHEHVKCIGDLRHADDYRYVCPQCGEYISDAERVAMLRLMQYRSVLPPEEAAKKTWIGAHFSQFMYPSKTLRSLMQRWIECGDDENSKRVHYNKVLGEPYDPKVKKVDVSALRSLIVVKRRMNDPEFYSRGQVPAGVRFLTAGQDSRGKEFHYSIWGWGMRRANDNTLAYCGWLIDWGVIQREYSLLFSESEYHVFDDLIYRRRFRSTVSDKHYIVSQCGHDIGYAPTQIAIIRYCRTTQGRAVPVKGASVEATSYSTAPYARWGTPITVRVGNEEIKDQSSRPLLLNTYLLKTEWYGWVNAGNCIEVPDIIMTPKGEEISGTRKVPHIYLPEDVDDEWIAQSSAESLVKGERSNELVWKRHAPNHLGDCNTYALGLARNLDWFTRETAEEAVRRPQGQRQQSRASESFDPAMG